MLRGVPVTAVTAILKLWPTASAYGVLNVAVPPGWVTGRPASPLMLLLELQFVSFGFVLEQSRTATVAVPVLSQYRAATTLNGLFTNTGAMKLSSPLASATGSTRKHLNELPWEPVGPVSPCGPVGPWRPCRPVGPVAPSAPVQSAAVHDPSPFLSSFRSGLLRSIVHSPSPFRSQHAVPCVPIAPVGPVGPCAPVAPGTPCSPCGPVAPCGPTEP